ncbi:MAG: MBL fold metallo-hydrolase [Rubrobacteridae bacterium]|nr:MBL fold metallo-hydrolase [Rubrobacteridae bacterium]
MKDTDENSNYIKFLGTAGGRYVVAKQLRYSAGTFIKINGKNIILDPGPGSLLRCAKSRPPIDSGKIDAAILSHSHIDHSNDINAIIDAMTEGGRKKRGLLFAPGDCLSGENTVVLGYLRDYLEDIRVMRGGFKYSMDDAVFRTSVRHKHGVETYGVKFDIDGFTVAFMTDTGFFPELIDDYSDADILVINVVLYKPNPEYKDIPHICLQEAADIIEAIKPKKAILTHFGMTMLKANPRIIAAELSERLGSDVIAASDGLTVSI